MNPSSIAVTVRYIAGTHQTNTVRGQRASSAAGYQSAARALGHKLFTGAFHIATRSGEQPTGTMSFDLWADEQETVQGGGCYA